MPIPISTTTITIKGKRPQSSVDPDADGYDSPTPVDTTLVTGVRASITLPQGSRASTDADAVTVYALRCDIIDGVVLTRNDTVVDETTGIEYEVSTAEISHPQAYGLRHVTARLFITKGLNAGGEVIVSA